MFEDCGFEVYKGKTTEYFKTELDEEEGAPPILRLEVKDVLYSLQQRWYQLEEELANEPMNYKDQVLTR